MPNRKKPPLICVPEDDTGCINSQPEHSSKKCIPSGKVYRLLQKQRVKVEQAEQKRFISFLDRSIRHRELAKKLWAKDKLKADDIIRLIQDARDAGDLDEATPL